jgi:hypothetical protein
MHVFFFFHFSYSILIQVIINGVLFKHPGALTDHFIHSNMRVYITAFNAVSQIIVRITT